MSTSNTVTKEDLKNILNEVLPNTSADYIVEQGKSGIWTYRKWNSGFYECYGNYSASIAITTSSGSYGGYRSGQITATAFPYAFIDTPTVIATSQATGGCWVNNVSDSTSTNAKFYLSCGTSSSATTRSIAISAFGTWK